METMAAAAAETEVDDEEEEAAADAVQASIRSNHLEFSVLPGPQPATPSPLAAKAREALVRSKAPLPAQHGKRDRPASRAAANPSEDDRTVAALSALSLSLTTSDTRSKQARNRTATTFFEAGQGGGLASSQNSAATQPSEGAADGGIDNETALDVTGFEVGDLVLAKGFSPTGERKWFQAKITKLRSVYPPIVIKYFATEDGYTQPLLLPTPRIAHVHRGDMQAMSES